ncbi:MAG: sulfatase-like hydrolase/transferase [Myxococcales bacterium]|nr:sulfatase-like hydrolase/transferase [Myxococcales bacterium]
MTTAKPRRVLLGLLLIAAGAAVALLSLQPDGPAAAPGGGRATAGTTGPAAPHARPNVVLISIDTCRADHLGCYGFDRPTSPNIDALAAQAVRFERAISTAPTTLPAHASMMTGLLPIAHGSRANGQTLAADYDTLAERLAAAGYETAAFVSAFVLQRQFGLAQGFATYDDVTHRAGARDYMDQRDCAATSEHALGWLRQERERPFFLFVHFFDPHGDYQPPEPFRTRLAGNPYAGEIAFADHCVGRLLASLRELGHYDDTLLILTADHGEGRGDHGEGTHSYFVYQSTVHVPLIIKPPGPARPTVIGQTVSLVDIFPTVLGTTGLSDSARTQGQDLSAWLSGKPPQAPRPAAIAECLEPTGFGCTPLFSLVLGSEKLIHGAHPELYDLAEDPHESHNLAAERPRRVAELKQRLSAALQGAPRQQAGEALQAETIARLRALGYTGANPRAAADPEDPLSNSPERCDPRDFFPLMRRHVMLHGQSELLLREGLKGATARTEAERLLEEASTLVAERPDVSLFHEDRAALLQLLGRDLEAGRALGSAWAAAPGAATVRTKLVALASKMLRAANAAGAAEALRPLVEVAPEAADARERASLYGLYGTALAAAGRWKAAASALETLLGLQPQQARGWLLLAEARLELADREAAGAALQRARELGATGDAQLGARVAVLEARLAQ